MLSNNAVDSLHSLHHHRRKDQLAAPHAELRRARRRHHNNARSTEPSRGRGVSSPAPAATDASDHATTVRVVVPLLVLLDREVRLRHGRPVTVVGVVAVRGPGGGRVVHSSGVPVHEELPTASSHSNSATVLKATSAGHRVVGFVPTVATASVAGGGRAAASRDALPCVGLVAAVSVRGGRYYSPAANHNAAAGTKLLLLLVGAHVGPGPGSLKGKHGGGQG